MQQKNVPIDQEKPSQLSFTFKFRQAGFTTKSGHLPIYIWLAFAKGMTDYLLSLSEFSTLYECVCEDMATTKDAMAMVLGERKIPGQQTQLRC